jgi:hypothetical protein
MVQSILAGKLVSSRVHIQIKRSKNTKNNSIYQFLYIEYSAYLHLILKAKPIITFLLLLLKAKSNMLLMYILLFIIHFYIVSKNDYNFQMYMRVYHNTNVYL